MEISPSWPLRTGDAWPTKAVPDGTDGPKPEANTFNCYPVQIKEEGFLQILIDRVRAD